MYANFQEFKAAVESLDNEIRDYYRRFETEGRRLISDGIINEEQYYNSKIKILWILKEPYDEQNNEGGGWSLTKDILAKDDYIQTLAPSKSTWYPIVYASYGLLSNFTRFDDMGNIPNDQEMVRCIKKIAFINVQKLAACTTTDFSNIVEAYKQHRIILLKQIQVYNPDIIIGGSTMGLFAHDLGLAASDKYKDHWIKDQRAYLNVYHPAQRQITWDKYVDEIVSAGEYCFNN